MNIKYRIIILTITFLLIFCVFLKVLNSNKTYQPNQMIGKKIPEFMKGLGKGVREFKDSMNDVKRDLEDTGREANKKIEDAQK